MSGQSVTAIRCSQCPAAGSCDECVLLEAWERMGASPVDALLSGNGHFARDLPGFQPRDGQLQLAAAVVAAYAGGVGTPLLGEAPTGTGKSLAYLVPAVQRIAARQASIAAWKAAQLEQEEEADDIEPRPWRLLVVTRGLALQDQLTKKDIPAIRRVMPWVSFDAVTFKGRSNYLCKVEVERVENEGPRRRLPLADEGPLSKIVEWARVCVGGERRDAPAVVSDLAWSELSVSADDCLGRGCPEADDCFSNIARRKAMRAEIVVTNYHALFAHYKHMHTVDFSGEFDAVVFDEAHELADIARDMLGETWGMGRFRSIANKLGHIGHNALAIDVEHAGETLMEAIETYGFSDLYEMRFKQPLGEDPAMGELFSEAILALNCAGSACGQLVRDSKEGGVGLGESKHEKKRRAYIQAVAERAPAFANNLAELAELRTPTEVVYSLDNAKAPRAMSRMVKAQLIRPGAALVDLFHHARTVLVSATLRTTDFGYIRRDLGLLDAPAVELVAPSPFNYGKQSVLSIDSGYPEPPFGRGRAFDAYVQHVADRLVEIAVACRGRTLGLFTARDMLNAVAEAIAPRLPYPVLCQGRDGPPDALAASLRATPEQVLLGVDSMWAGLDIPGDALVAVAIARLPFPNPRQPITDALIELISHKNWKAEYRLPAMLMQLRQGTGRLIRTMADVGGIFMLDPRAATTYGSAVLQALPSMPVVRSEQGRQKLLAALASRVRPGQDPGDPPPPPPPRSLPSG